MFEKKLEAGRHILTGKPIPLMRDGEEISGGYARWARAGRYSSSRPEGLFVYSSHCVGNGYGLLDGVQIYCRRHNWRRSVKMEEQKLIQMIRFDHDLVVFIEGSDDQQRQVNIYGYAMHQAVNVWDFVEWLCTRKMRAVFAGNPYAFPDIVNWLGGKLYAIRANYILTHRGLLLPWNAVDGGTVWKPRY